MRCERIPRLDCIQLAYCGTDAHGKNYALLIGSGGKVRLAPLYDLASVLPYPDIDFERTKLSMKLGGEIPPAQHRARHWRNLGEELHVDPDVIIRRVNDFAKQLGDHVSDVRHRMTEEGLAHPIIRRLADRSRRAPSPVRESFIRIAGRKM